jgi:hypothetical protein
MNISTSFHIGTKLRKKTINIYLPMQERQAVIKETNYMALFLLEYYLSVFAWENYVITDEKSVTATGFSLRSVQDHRRLLEKKNLFCELKTTGSGVTSYLYCARKEGVYCMKYFDKLFGYNTVRGVCRKYSREKVADILAKEKLNQMEVKDIEYLLECYRG